MLFQNKINTNQLKRELVTSIQKNTLCMEYLEEVRRKAEDVYKYTNDDEDRKTVEKIKWVEFQIAYLSDKYCEALKKNGGNPNAIQPFEWE